MKVSYSSLHCPHCSSKSFDLINDDIFICDYCGQKFNFNLEEIDFNSENKVFIEELKEQFNNKIAELNREKNLNHDCLLICRKRAYPNALTTIATIILVVSIIVLFESIFVPNLLPIAFAIPFKIVSILNFTAVKLYGNYRYKKYQPLLSVYAEKIVDCENKINAYTNILSKLTK